MQQIQTRRKMNPRVKKIVVDALRSGKYKQTRYKMRTYEDDFCVLGVICNEHAKEHPEIAAKQTNKTMYLGHTMSLPREVCEWLGIQPVEWCELGPSVWINYIQQELARHNDAGASFEQLADAIEEQL